MSLSSAAARRPLTIVVSCCLEDIPLPRIRYEDVQDHYGVDDCDNRWNRRGPKRHRGAEEEGTPRPKRRPADGSESFKCGHCKAFIGPTVSVCAMNRMKPSIKSST